ncbi:leucine-rich repeat protein [Treponema sp. OMZ 855]|uniref:leucine-rich repeat protein n=1 Tax=Treponema sp. OMZ 855 TaxID=1643512 RepID=UPI0020A5BABA|nr:leucine-rich repeat protein [Treponema sp. OMZ 855]UTC51265.1 leucine-rich repeat protein [Treponema sp. OMZ 855]
MRKVFTLLTGIFFTFLCTSCEQFTSNIDTYLSYWAAEVSATGYSIDQLQKPYPTNKDGVLCIPSTSDVTVTINLRNPKNFQLVMPDSSSSYAGKVIRFPGFKPDEQPGYGTDYTLTQTANDKLELKYKSTFLKAHEWGNGNISPEITFITDDPRVFRSKFSLNLKVDTAPALEYAGIGKTATADSDGNHFYVLIFRVKDMDKMIDSQSVHKDINTMNITAGGVSRPPITLNVTGSDFTPDGNLLAADAVQKLKPTDPELPTGNGLLRLKTDVKVGGPEKAYEVCIKDEQGLSSEVIRASTQKNKLANVQLFDGSTEITGTSDSNPKGIPGIKGKTLTAKAAFTGTAITGTVYKKKADGTWEQLSGSGGTVSGTTTAAVNLPALAASGTEALYKISLKAQLSGYDDSDSKDFFVKLLWQEVPVLKLKQNFNDSDPSLHCISAGTKAYVTEDIIPDAGQYTAENPLLIYTAPFSNFKLELSASAGTAVKYKLGSGAEQSPSAPAEITVIGGTVYPLEVWTERGGIPGLHTTVYIKGFGTLNTYSELKNVVKNAPENGTGPEQYDYSSSLYIFIGSDLAASAADTEIAVTGGKKLELLSSTTTVRTLNAGGNARIFKVSGNNTELALGDIKLEGGYAADGKGGAVYVEAGGILKLTGKTVITPSIAPNANTPGKNDVYLSNGASIKVDGTLTSTDPIVARITPETYSEGTQVLTGDITSGTLKNYKRFSVTQPAGSTDIWTIKSDGRLQKISAVINGSDTLAWQKLKNAVQNFPNGSIITINGEIKATNEGTAGVDANWGEIVIDKNLTIKGKTGAGSDILNANSTTTDPNAPTAKHRIFNVANGKTLTLENLTLKNGKNNETDPGGSSNPNGKGGAIYSKGELEIRNVLITNCEAKYSGGGIYCNMFGTTSTDERKLVIANTEVASCKALDTTYGLGGGVSIQGSDCLMNVKITDVMIKNNDAGSSAAGLCLYGNHNATTTADSVVLTRVTLHKNKLTGTSAAGGAGMVFATYGPNNAITLKNCTVTKNESTTIGGGILLRTSSSGNVCGKLILENSSVTENKAQNGGGVYVNWSNLVMKNTDFTSNTATAEGGGVYVAKGTFEMEGSATVTPSAEAHKNDVYLAADTTATAKIKLNGALTGTPPVARITVPNDKYLPTTQVLTGSITAGTSPNQNYTKFTVTPQTLSDGKILYWEVDAAGKLMGIVDGTKYPNSAWKALKDAVDNATAGETIFIRGTVQATADTSTVTGNSGDITINKNLTIKGESETSIGILDANKNTGGKPKHRIFKVEIGKTLTIQNLTLTGGIADGTGEAGTGGAIYAKGATVNINGCTLKGNEAKSGGAICAEKDGSTPSNVTISGGTIGGTGADANKATGTDSDNGFGGAVFIKGSTVNINGCTLEGNKAKNGGGVYMEGGNCTLNGSLKNNKTTEIASSFGGSIYLENGTLTMKTGAEISGSEASVSGGGVYISARDGGTASFTMEGGTISGCKVSSAYFVDGGGVCVEVAHGSTGTANFIMKGGSITGCKVESGGFTGSPFGGGVCVKNRATFDMTGGSITGCKAEINHNAGTPESRGGGVYMENSTFNMSGSSSITGCTAESSDSDISGSPSFYGGGVYAAGSTATFTMKDSAVITPSSEVPSGMKRFNDVYLNSDAKITVAGSLTPPGGIAARITPAAYNTTTQVLTAGTGVTLANETYKFAVTPKIVSGTPQPWTVGGNGCLKQGRYTEVPYGKLAAFLANASSTEVNYIEVTGITASDLKGTYASPPNPGPLGALLNNNSSKKVALKLPNSISGLTDMSACFSQCENLVSLENFPSGVTDMRACFYGCENLTTVPAIPATVTSMMECFRYCRSLTTVPNIPSGVYDMTRCFQYCEKLQSIKMNCPYGVNFNGAFSGCDALPNGGIKVPLLQLAIYKNNAGTMGTTKEKFSAITP